MLGSNQATRLPNRKQWSGGKIGKQTTHFCRITDGGGAGKLYIIGKGIYRRVRFILDIDKIFWY